MGNFEFLIKNQKISQHILQKSMTFKTDFLTFGRVKKLWSVPIILDPQLFVGGFPKGFHFYDPYRSLKMVRFGYLNKSEISQTIL